MGKTEAYIVMQTENPEALQAKLRSELQDVGVDRFNREHKSLLEEFLKLQRLMEDFRNGRTSEDGWWKVDGLLAFLFRYTDEHFTAEEEAMARAGFKGLTVHKALHDQFRRALKDYEAVIKARDLSGIFSLKYDLFDWFFNHINMVDTKYSGAV